MIVLLLLLVLALVAGGLFAWAMARDPGYVLVSYDGATVETSLWFALACLIVVAVAVTVTVALLRRLLHGGGAVADWFRWRRVAKARDRSLEALLFAAEGRWREAKRAFLESAGKVDTPLANFLAAARAANELGEFGERDDILDGARRSAPKAAFAINLAQAELQQASAQWTRSIATLERLRKDAPRHPLVLKRLFDAHRALDDWGAVAELAPALPKEAGADLDAVQTAAWLARLRKSRDSVDAAEHARNAWRAMPRRLRANGDLVLAYVDAVADDAPADAEALLRRSLNKDWRDDLVGRYGRIQANPEKQLAIARQWLKARPANVALLVASARLAAQTGDAEAAREYLQASLVQGEDAEALAELGNLCSASGQVGAANEYLRRALESKSQAGGP